MQANTDGTYPAAPTRVIVRHADPCGPGTVISETAWTATVRMDACGREYLFGKSVIEADCPVTNR